MKHDGLDPKGKVELARMLLQIGFKTEAVAEFLMAAKMYEETEEREQALKLYEKVLSIDEGNAEAQRALYRLEPRSQTQIDDIIDKMGFGPPKSPVSDSTAQTTTLKPTKEPEVPAESPTPQPPESAPVEVLHHKEKEATLPEVVSEPPKQKETRDLSKIDIDEFLASLTVTLDEIPDDPGLRKQLFEFFRDEELWSDAFFEARASYLTQPSVEKLEELLMILSASKESHALSSFISTECYLDRPVDVQKMLLERLIEISEKEGLSEKASEAKRRLAKLSDSKPKSTVRIIKETPPIGEKNSKSSKDKKQSGPIQFI